VFPFVLYDHAFTALPRGPATLVGPFDSRLLLASVIAVEISIVVRFALNDRWTFQDRRRKSLTARFYQHNLGSLGSPIISLAAVNILTPLLGLSYLIANSLGILLGLSWNWLWSIRVVWVSDIGDRRAPQESRALEDSNPALNQSLTFKAYDWPVVGSDGQSIVESKRAELSALPLMR